MLKGEVVYSMYHKESELFLQSGVKTLQYNWTNKEKYIWDDKG